MKRPHQPYYGRSHTKKTINPPKPRLSDNKRKTKQAQKQLAKLFPRFIYRLNG